MIGHFIPTLLDSWPTVRTKRSLLFSVRARHYDISGRWLRRSDYAAQRWHLAPDGDDDDNDDVAWPRSSLELIMECLLHLIGR